MNGRYIGEHDEWLEVPDPVNTSGMWWPVSCRHCGHVHDAGKVTVVQRYSDCSTWRCPGCDTLIDDRPVAWGGSAISLKYGRDHA